MLLSSPQELSGRLFEDVVGQIKKDMICIEAHRLSEQSLLLFGRNSDTRCIGGRERVHFTESNLGLGARRLDLISRLSALYSRIYAGARLNYK